MSSSDAIKAAMESCQKGIETLQARVRQNGELTAAKERERGEWNTQKGAHEHKCNVDRGNTQAAQRDWDNRRNDIFNSKNDEEQKVRNGSCSNFQGHWCQNDFGNGWEHKRNDTNWANCGHVVCKKTHDQKMHEANDQTSRERGGRPGDFHCPGFPRPWPEDAQLDTTPITVGCCANQTNVIGSQLNDSSISQNNNCLSSLQDDFRIKKAEEEALAKVAADKAAADKAAAEAAAQAAANKPKSSSPSSNKPEAVAAASSSGGVASATETGETEEEPQDNKNMIMLIVALLICFCLCISVVALMMML
jgi:hypothetical protein